MQALLAVCLQDRSGYVDCRLQRRTFLRDEAQMVSPQDPFAPPTLRGSFVTVGVKVESAVGRLVLEVLLLSVRCHESVPLLLVHRR